MKSSSRFAMVFAFSCLLAAPLGAATTASTSADTRHVDAAVRGQLVDASGTPNRAEVVHFGDAVAPELLATAPEQSVHVAGWPVAPGERADVVLTRHEVYAPGAKVYRVEGGKTTEVPRSRLAFLWGTAEDDPDTRVFAAVDPDDEQLDGFALSAKATHEIHPLGSAKLGVAVPGVRQYLVAPPEVFLEQAGQSPTWTCGQNGAPLPFLLNQETVPHLDGGLADSSGSLGSLGSLDKAITTLHTAVLAIDTDKELLSIKFGNNTTTAGNYVASLIAQMNVIYQRDLLIQLMQGNTFLRVGSDPWTQPSTGGANVNQLNEVSTYWSTTNDGITRAFVAMLSGKGGSGASGIAWVPGSLCSHAYGVSFSQVYTSGTSPSFGDVLVVAHEIGHNFGSPHTHCYNPPIDTCYNGEAANGCFSGSPSCPAPTTINGVTNVKGTLMSYCHILGGCTSSLVFHPTTVAKIQPLIQSAVNSCIFPAATAVGVSAIVPSSGLTTGGTPVTITGSGFVSGAAVSLGGAAATSVSVVSSTKITAVAPAHATGKVSVAVTNPGGAGATLSNGFFYTPPPSQSDLYTLTPCRLVDTRNPNGALGGPALGASAQRIFTAAGHCGIPSGASAVLANITSVSPSAPGFVAVYPGNAFPLGTTVINFTALATRANNTILALATDGTGTFGIQNASGGTANVVVDVVGYFN
jgi:Metallo-peptidase family M12/IPT/TIG domain